MIGPKRLIEIDLPIRRISAHARREKSIRHGHISTMHIWWARRPLAACRAVLCAALWPDPADPACPDSFREIARAWMRKWGAQYTHLLSGESLNHFVEIQKNPKKLNDNQELRNTLLDFIADFANWDNSTVNEYLETSHSLTQAAHEALGGVTGTRPLVVDSFAGGGAIPLEALRIGADAFASDLNPVAVLLNKVILEYVPKYGQRLADELHKWGEWLKEQAQKEIARFYPPDPDGAIPIAYLWARTIRCEGPGCGAEIPLMRSLWLARRGSRSIALQVAVNTKNKHIDFKIVDNIKSKDVQEGTMRRGSVLCPVCNFTTPVSSVRKQLQIRQGGTSDARLVCVVTTRSGENGRSYRMPSKKDLEAVLTAIQELDRQKKQYANHLSLIPDEPLPPQGALGFRVQLYGMQKWGELFTPRQALALSTLVRLVREAGKKFTPERDKEFTIAVQTCLGLIVDKMADKCSSLCRWKTSAEYMAGNTFGRQALPMVWDFCETNIFGQVTGDIASEVEWVEKMLSHAATSAAVMGHAQVVSANAHPLPDQTAQCFFTDPPYYDSVPYADLSDFFYVWLKRTVGDLHPDLFREMLTPKQDECIVDEVKGKDQSYFEKTMAQAMAEGRRILSDIGIGVIVFAHKSTAGWEAMLQAMNNAGWTMTGSWPIDTEMGSRLRAMDSAALASSVHLVCRPRLTNAPVGDWRDVLTELPKRIHEWMPRLRDEGIVGADAIFACLGPALEIYSRYSKVEKANGDAVLLKEYLEHVWAAVAKEALSMIFHGAEAVGFEEDSRLTAMWLWTLSARQNGVLESKAESAENENESETPDKSGKASGLTLEYDTARKIAQGLGIHLEQLTNVLEVKGDKARLLPVSERGKRLMAIVENPIPVKSRKKAEQVNMAEILGKSMPSKEGSVITVSEAFKPGNTMLDRVHQCMILFASGRGDALKRFLVDDAVGADAKFWQLAQSLSALYPKTSEEKRWVDGVLARKKGLGL